jgi:hypothetical protein
MSYRCLIVGKFTVDNIRTYKYPRLKNFEILRNMAHYVKYDKNLLIHMVRLCKG